MAADVAGADRAEQRVRQRVQRRIGVGVAGEPTLARDLDAAEDERSAGNERVNVEAVADTERHGAQATSPS